MSTAVVDPMRSVVYEVQRIRKETSDTFTLELHSTNGSNDFPFAAGQFNMLYVFGVGEIPISISGDPSKHRSLIHTTRAVGLVTGAMRQLKRGDSIGVRGPFGSHWPVEHATGYDVVIVAGGLGLAPVRPALYHILHHREKYGNVVLLYGSRTPNDILFRREVEKWRARLDVDVHVTVDRAIHPWRGNVGVVTRMIPKAPFDPLNTVAFICGPEIMMRFTVLELQKRGVTTDKIFISMERNMKCAVGFCGHCQWGPNFVCKDGPVFDYASVKHFFEKREI
ncbi:MAG: Ni/Fe hydrogenase subunit gamma [Chloroflexaceae bacterium]|nr:Ni/Fe hydrogenase subunit gamma [Chloroflexaceae bacterium]